MIWLYTFTLAFAVPKYAPGTEPLARAHGFMQNHAAPDYWALSPHYVGQLTSSACSVAVIAQVVNAARAKMPLTQDDRMVTQSAVLNKLGDDAFRKEVAEGGPGVPLERLADLLARAFKLYGVKGAKIDVVTKIENLRSRLADNEKSARDFIIAGFDQGVFTGDEHVGHYGVVGAYDRDKRRVLIFDPDREWFEPYWVSEGTFVKGLTARDPVAPNGRGYLHVHLP